MNDAKETTSDSEEIECPHCGETIHDLWDYCNGNEELFEIECSHCDKLIALRRVVSVDYYATAVPT